MQKVHIPASSGWGLRDKLQTFPSTFQKRVSEKYYFMYVEYQHLHEEWILMYSHEKNTF